LSFIQREYYAALQWYRDRSIKAARQFEAEFVHAVEQIQNAPERWSRYSSGCRRFLLHQFPFQIVYEFAERIETNPKRQKLKTGGRQSAVGDRLKQKEAASFQRLAASYSLPANCQIEPGIIATTIPA